MSRIGVSIVALLAAAAPAVAADWGMDWGDETAMRGSYFHEPKDWSGLGDEDDTISVETGLRYWYSMGTQSVGSAGVTSEADSTAHIGEGFLRVEDTLTASYARAVLGYSMVISGNYDDGITSGDINDGTVAYAGADFGWNPFRDANGNGFGGLIGYQYWQEAPDTGRFNFTTLSPGDTVSYNDATGQTFVTGDSAENHVDIHALRLGVQGKATVNDLIDFRAEVAAVPYAMVSGTVGVDDPLFSTAVYSGAAQQPYTASETGNISWMRASETEINGWGYGAMAEAFVGIHPMENLTFRVGGRAWYVQGTADATYDAVAISDPEDVDTDSVYEVEPVVTGQTFIDTNNPFSFFRYGLLAELTYRF